MVTLHKSLVENRVSGEIGCVIRGRLCGSASHGRDGRLRADLHEQVELEGRVGADVQTPDGDSLGSVLFV